MRSIRRLAALFVVLASGCGIGAQGSAQPVDVTVVVVSGGDSAPAASADAQGVFLIEDGAMVEAGRDLPGTIEARQLVTALLAGPTQTESDRGLATAIPSSTLLLGARLDDGTLQLDLSADFASVGGDREISSVAQLVLTVTSLPGVERVVLTLDGTAVQVPLADGELTDEPVSRADYVDLLAD